MNNKVSTILQWVLFLGLISTLFTGYLSAYISVPVILFLMYPLSRLMGVRIYLFKPPQKVLTDSGWVWTRIRKHYEQPKNYAEPLINLGISYRVKDKFNIALYKNFGIFWRIIARSGGFYELDKETFIHVIKSTHNIYTNDLSRKKDKINKDKFYYKRFSDWNKIATDNKDLLRREAFEHLIVKEDIED